MENRKFILQSYPYICFNSIEEPFLAFKSKSFQRGVGVKSHAKEHLVLIKLNVEEFAKYQNKIEKVSFQHILFKSDRYMMKEFKSTFKLGVIIKDKCIIDKINLLLSQIIDVPNDEYSEFFCDNPIWSDEFKSSDFFR